MMGRLKEKLRKSSGLYRLLCKIKDRFVRQGQWGKVYRREPPYDKEEPSIEELMPLVPAHITTILDIGCGSGRNLLPYQRAGRFTIWGIDLVPREKLNFPPELGKVRYEKMSAQELTRFLNEGAGIDLTHTLVHTHSLLTYLTGQEQRELYGALLAAGCRNFHFEEYPRTLMMQDTYFQLSENQFINKRFRPQEGMPIAHYHFE